MQPPAARKSKGDVASVGKNDERSRGIQGFEGLRSCFCIRPEDLRCWDVRFRDVLSV